MGRLRATTALLLGLLLAVTAVADAEAAYSVRLGDGGSTVRFRGDGASDMLVLSVRADGKLAHNRELENGLLGPTDMDTRVGLQEVYPARGLTVLVDAGAGSDTVLLSGQESAVPVGYGVARGRLSRSVAGEPPMTVALGRDVEASGIRGGGGDDVVAVIGLVPASVDGGGGADELSVHDLVDGGARYELGPTAVSRPGVALAHGAFEGLSLSLGDGPDGVTVAAGAPRSLLRGGGGDDVLDAGAATAAAHLQGEDGADALAGGVAVDVFEGGAGDDRITASDGVAERIACGSGIDRAVADDRDTDLSSCETVERRQPGTAPGPGTGDGDTGGAGGDTEAGGGSGAGGGSHGGAGPAGDVAPSDGVAPVLRSLRLDLTRISTRRGARATRIRFVVSEVSRITVTLQRCAGRRNSCRVLRRAGAFTRPAITGANSIRFTGRVGGRRLRPGTYRVTVVARDAGGLASIPRRAVLRVRR